MQSTHYLTKQQINPARGLLFCEPILGSYETESGILVVKDMRRNPKIDRMKVISIGGPFTNHGGKRCKICKDYCPKKEKPGEYWALPGDTIWTRRGFKKMDIEGKTHCFVHNADVIVVLKPDGRLLSVADLILVEPIYDEFVEGSKIIYYQERDKQNLADFHGLVVAVGPEYRYGVFAGDKITFRRNQGSTHEGIMIEVEGRKLYSLKSKWADAIIKD